MKVPTSQGNICAGFFPRLAAGLLDCMIIGCLIGGLEFIKNLIESFAPDFILFGNLLFQFDIFDIVFYLLFVLYFALFTSFAGTTPGKRAFNLAVTDMEGNKIGFWKAVYRESVGKFLSSFLAFGYIMILIEKRNRSFHDYLCDTYVIYTVKIKCVLQGSKGNKAQPKEPYYRPITIANQPVSAPTVNPVPNLCETPTVTEAPVINPVEEQAKELVSEQEFEKQEQL